MNRRTLSPGAPVWRLAALVVAAGFSSGTAVGSEAGDPEAGDPEPIVIAHRGASGYLPEHTLAAYALGYGQGADFIEPDLVLTRDGELICLHDIHLGATTDVEETFPGRAREDGRWYAVDFDLDEIRRLRVHERLGARFPRGASSFSVPTFGEMVELVKGLNSTTGRRVGVYPELKQPAFHEREGRALEEPFLEAAAELGLGVELPVYVQSFERESLRRMRALGSDLPQVFLLGADASRVLSATGLDEVALFANGIGPSKGLLARVPGAVELAHARGLVVHPYTFRADDLGQGYSSFSEELAAFYDELGVDGVFTDFPDLTRVWIDGSR